MKDQLLDMIRDRGHKQAAFGRGIITADRWIETLRDCIGLDACNKFLAKGSNSFNDQMTKAADVLTYNNDEMVVEEKRLSGTLRDVELPKNTLMVFKHVLTSSSKDRDDDVLHSDGAVVDPKMLLLWQHCHVMPIGKYLATVQQNKKRLVVASAIVDVNSLAHDAAVMIDNDMGRFSHGFRALEYTEVKDEDTGDYAFDVTGFEIMEESLVSVPANADAETQEVLLSMIEGKQLTSSLMKRVGRGIRERRDVQVPVRGIGVRYRERLGDYRRELTCDSLADLKTAADAGLIGEKDENKSGDREGTNGEGTGTRAPEKADVIPNEEGQTTGSCDTQVKEDIKSDIKPDVKADNEKETMHDVVGIIKATIESTSAQQAMAIFLAKASPEQRKHMAGVLDAIERGERSDPITEQYRALVGSL